MDILTKIIYEKIPCFFISPHLDDAIFSAGGLINYLSDKTKVEILTVFTEAGPKPYTRFSKKFMKACGFSDADIFFQARRKEDRQICQSLGIGYQHLNFTDVAWRKKQYPNFLEKTLGAFVPEFLHLYPLGRNFMSGKVVKEDKDMISNIKKTINKYQLIVNNFVVFSPLAIGNHVDHVIVRDICKELFSANLIYWTDYPYINWGNTKQSFINKTGLRNFTWNKNLEKKRELILGYKTQIPALFPKGLPKVLSEVFYLKS